MNEGIVGFLGFLAFCFVVLLFSCSVSKRRLHGQEEPPNKPMIYSKDERRAMRETVVAHERRLRGQEQRLREQRSRGTAPPTLVDQFGRNLDRNREQRPRGAAPLTAHPASVYEEVNKHPLNQKALELLRSVGETPHPRTQLHILMLLEWLGNHRRQEIKPEFPFDDILIDLRALPPEQVMRLLMRAQEERRQRKKEEYALKFVDNMSLSQLGEFVGQLLQKALELLRSEERRFRAAHPAGVSVARVAMSPAAHPASVYEEVNNHPLNQKALELLRSVGETPRPRTQLHILMLLEWLGNHRRQEIKPEFPFDDILIDLRALPPERVMPLLMREQEERRRRKEGESPLKLADVDNMTPSQFEEFVGQLLKHQGYKATVIGKTGDMGVDVVAQKGSKKYAVQVKRYNQPVSRQAISDAVAGKEYYECNAAMVVTNSSFTKAALKFASKIQCDLVDRDTLANWIEDSHVEKIREATEDREQQIQGYILEEVQTPTEMLKFLQGTLTEWTPR